MSGTGFRRGISTIGLGWGSTLGRRVYKDRKKTHWSPFCSSNGIVGLASKANAPLTAAVGLCGGMREEQKKAT